MRTWPYQKSWHAKYEYLHYLSIRLEINSQNKLRKKNKRLWIQFKIFIALFLGNATNGQKKTHTGKTTESGRGSSWGSTCL